MASPPQIRMQTSIVGGGGGFIHNIHLFIHTWSTYIRVDIVLLEQEEEEE